MKWLLVAVVVGLSSLRSTSSRIELDGKDPDCKTGIRSLKVGEAAAAQQVCCPSYCKECGDNAKCKNVFGPDTKDSSSACCATKVVESATVKSCGDALPPCKLDNVDFTTPDAAQAEEDCDKARQQMNDALEAGVQQGKGAR